VGIGAGHQAGHPVERVVERTAARPGRGAQRVVREAADAHPEQQPVTRQVLHGLDLRGQPQQVPGRHVDDAELDADPNTSSAGVPFPRTRSAIDTWSRPRSSASRGGQQVGGVVDGQADADVDGGSRGHDPEPAR
jgi:hypothetical protein